MTRRLIEQRHGQEHPDGKRHPTPVWVVVACCEYCTLDWSIGERTTRHQPRNGKVGNPLVSLIQVSNRPRLLECPCCLLLATEHQVLRVKTESHHFCREAQSGLTSHPNSREYWGLLRFAQEVKLPRTHGWKPFDKTRDFLSWCGRRISLAPPASVCERGSDGWKSQSIQFMSKRPAKHFHCAPLRAVQRPACQCGLCGANG
ncbi:hypothetical protein N656DRAFT_94561 [Canariomyces notabilis]|uniref:Uncharacterized protein n=1 Tax=Canariomyces notabilis TaxID=2074819 RepID=A0AAN6YS43_9PEZI|nr:hypothetical protein N656DRAFT_94561 [Canariomyces arenarius]